MAPLLLLLLLLLQHLLLQHPLLLHLRHRHLQAVSIPPSYQTLASNPG